MKLNNRLIKEDLEEVIESVDLSAIVNSLIQGEYGTINQMENILKTLKDSGKEDELLFGAIEEVLYDEYTHVGVYESVLRCLNPAAEMIEDGEKEMEQNIEDLAAEEAPVEEAEDVVETLTESFDENAVISETQHYLEPVKDDYVDIEIDYSNAEPLVEIEAVDEEAAFNIADYLGEQVNIYAEVDGEYVFFPVHLLDDYGPNESLEEDIEDYKGDTDETIVKYFVEVEVGDFDYAEPDNYADDYGFEAEYVGRTRGDKYDNEDADYISQWELTGPKEAVEGFINDYSLEFTSERIS